MIEAQSSVGFRKDEFDSKERRVSCPCCGFGMVEIEWDEDSSGEAASCQSVSNVHTPVYSAYPHPSQLQDSTPNPRVHLMVR
jgi:hypothetical protein